MKIPLVDLKAQYKSIGTEIDLSIKRVIDKTNFILSEEVDQFEKEFAFYLGVRHAVGISSGTDAIHLALRACGVGPGDEVITSTMTFTATAEAIVMVGATPVFIDISPDTANMDPTKIEENITQKTKAILPVHLHGHPVELTPIMDIAKKYNLLLIEDAAQAHGARYNGQYVGAFGDVACFSFYPGKNLGAYGDAGAVVTNNDHIAERIRLLHDHGRKDKYEHLEVGYGNRLDEIQAAILRVKLRYLNDWNDQRRKIAGYYSETLNKNKITLPYVIPESEPVWHQFVIRSEKRDLIKNHLNACGIATGIHYPIPLHLQPAYLNYRNIKHNFPNAEIASREMLSIPVYPELNQEQLIEIVKTINSAF